MIIAANFPTSHYFTPYGKIWTQLIDLALSVWLYSSVGRASHRHRAPSFGMHWDVLSDASVFNWLQKHQVASSLLWKIFTNEYSQTDGYYWNKCCLTSLFNVDHKRKVNVILSPSSSAYWSHSVQMYTSLGVIDDKMTPTHHFIAFIIFF